MYLMRTRGSRGASLAFGLALAWIAGPAAAQGRPDAARGLETRAALEAEARTAEQQNRSGEAFLLRNRLQHGDFQEGDRIVVSLLGSTVFNDTIVVRAGKLLPLPRMGDVALEGVLRSELNARVSSQLARFLRDSSVRTTPLLRLAVLGQVGRPGFYYTPADVLLSDVIMIAGGPAQNADMGRMSIRRGGETIWNAQDTRTAVSDGLSLDRLHMRAGDELYVEERKQGFNWLQALQVGGTVLGLAVAVLTLTHR
jgi:protein involved in polysaccharide export with SLBB domain